MTTFHTSTSNQFFPRVRGTLEERFWSKVITEPNTGCWLWCGDTNGVYGNIGVRGVGKKQVRKLAHRLSWEINVGPVPDGMELDHKCRTTLCVNPAHLRVATRSENIMAIPETMRGGKAKKTATVCKNGHELTGDNVTIVRRKKYPYKICAICRKASYERYRRRNGVRHRAEWLADHKSHGG